ncbi:hypothetical protein SCHPADRAFT_751796 [Schizopora paradoxa]|uniref:Uncharacterized protein n=1 Tax=Schizopora paradoxa TaxID=27342 RepID=A0A0H2R503_9AGAM|nr:hypothetical protein SCHPADRAFT_751796 [Schizopora paradoxa]
MQSRCRDASRAGERPHPLRTAAFEITGPIPRSRPLVMFPEPPQRENGTSIVPRTASRRIDRALTVLRLLLFTTKAPYTVYGRIDVRRADSHHGRESIRGTSRRRSSRCWRCESACSASNAGHCPRSSFAAPIPPPSNLSSACSSSCSVAGTNRRRKNVVVVGVSANSVGVSIHFRRPHVPRLPIRRPANDAVVLDVRAVDSCISSQGFEHVAHGVGMAL